MDDQSLPNVIDSTPNLPSRSRRRFRNVDRTVCKNDRSSAKSCIEFRGCLDESRPDIGSKAFQASLFGQANTRSDAVRLPRRLANRLRRSLFGNNLGSCLLGNFHCLPLDIPMPRSRFAAISIRCLAIRRIDGQTQATSIYRSG